jgi:hypothetical protein
VRVAARCLAVCLFAVLLPAAALAQFTPHGYDIQKYEIEVRPDFSTGELRVGALIVIDNRAREPVIPFGLSAQYEEVTVEVNGRTARARRTAGLVEIDVPTDSPTLRLRFQLRGRNLRSDDEKRGAIDADSLFLLWSDRFYPIDFVDWAPVETSVLLPAGMPGIAPGVLQSTRSTPEGVWHTFQAARPTVCFSVFADRRWVRSERRVGRLRLQTLLHPEVQRFADTIFRTSGDVLAFYTDLHGFYPAEEFAFITIAGMYARRAFPGFIGYTPEYLEKTMASDGYDGHETALLWWGYAARGAGPGAFQWTEGFGDYVEMMYAEARRRPIPANLQRARAAYLALPAGSDVPLDLLRGNTPQPLVHGRLPWMMDAHRRCVGDRRFRRAVRGLFERFRYRTFTLDEFLTAMGAGQPGSCPNGLSAGGARPGGR